MFLILVLRVSQSKPEAPRSEVSQHASCVSMRVISVTFRVRGLGFGGVGVYMVYGDIMSGSYIVNNSSGLGKRAHNDMGFMWCVVAIHYCY